MITKNYNPSPLEVQFAEALSDMKEALTERLRNYTVIKIDNNTQLDNPRIDLLIKDKDGDAHEIVLKIIQKPDKTN
jgi:hypothetical protein